MNLIEPESVRKRLLAMILVVALPLAGVMGYIWWQSLQQGRNLAIALLNSDASLIQRDVLQLRQDTEWVLAHMAEAPEIRGLQPTACRDRVRYLYEMQPALELITLWNPDGSLICSSSEPDPVQPAPTAHQPTFDLAIATDGMYISDIFRGPVTGRNMVAFTYPVKDITGATIGLLSLPVLLEYFLKPLLSLETSPGYAAGIIDSKDILLARIPDNEKWSGIIGTGDAVVEASRAGGNGIVPDIGIDGLRRIYVYKTIPEMGWRVYVGIEDKVLFAGYRQQLLYGSLLFLAVVSLSLSYAVYLGRRISRPLESLVEVADAVATGDLTRRVEASTNDQIGQVVQHFNMMLDAQEGAQRSLEQVNRDLQDLSDRLQRAEENERSRISRELHDQIGQELTALTLDLDVTSRSKVAKPELLQRCIATTARLLRQVRDITLALRPRLLDDLGLVAALRGQATRYVSTTGLQVHFDASTQTQRFGSQIETSCFRIAQEIFTNILRHAKADNVWISLRENRNELVLQVRDDGIGFDVDTAVKLANNGLSSGLLNLFDRAAVAGGKLQIDSTPGKGTTVLVHLPIQQVIRETESA